MVSYFLLKMVPRLYIFFYINIYSNNISKNNKQLDNTNLIKKKNKHNNIIFIAVI